MRIRTTGTIRTAAFGLGVTLLFFLLVEGILAIAGVQPLHERADPFVGFAGYSPLFVESTTAEGERVFETSPAKIDWFNRQDFPAQKADGARRVVCLGGSTTYGRPYTDATSFCGWLRAFLPAVDPGTRWEVINAGGISYASYRIVRLMEEIVRHEPDLFIVYTGHNEFLERRTYGRLLETPELVRDLASLASRLRLYSALSDVVYPETDVLEAEVETRLDDSIGPEDYHRNDAMHDAVLRHFRVSLERMTRIGRETGAEMIFVKPASNIRDFSPFKSEPGPGLDSARVEQVGNFKRSIADHLAGERPADAADLADRAAAIDPRDADLQFQRGRALLALDRLDEARGAFVSARDEDVAPLRAVGGLADVVAEVAAATGAGLVDFARMVESAAPDGIPGDEQFLDHVHPSIEANRTLGLAILDEMIARDLVSPAPTWGDEVVARITERVTADIDPAANAMALANLARVLSWAGKQEEALSLARRATEMTRDPHTLYQMVTVLIRNARPDEALAYSEEAARLMPDIADVRKINGILLAQNGRNAHALEELVAAARLDPTLPDIHYHLGVVLWDLGRREQAEEAYRTAIQLRPDNADALNNLGIILAQRGDVERAVDLFQRAIEAVPGHPGATDNLARARRLLGR